MGSKLMVIGFKIDETRIDGDLSKFRNDLEKFAALGMEGVEIPVHGLDAIRKGTLDRKRLKEIKNILRDFQFRYSVHSPNPLNLMDQLDPQIQYSVFQASLEFAEEIGAKVVVYHAGRFHPEEAFGLPFKPQLSPEKEEQLLIRERIALRELADEFPEIIIAVENARPYLFHSPYGYGEKLEVLKDMVEKVDRSNVRVTLDIGHLYMAANFFGFEPVDAVIGIREMISHTHIHDNFGGSIYYNEKIQTHQIPFGRGDAHMPVGWGEIPFQAILSAYIHGQEGMMIQELRSRYFANLKEAKENLIQLIESLKFERGEFDRTQESAIEI
jgi:sugar phosphate isomerase/epimerase